MEEAVGWMAAILGGVLGGGAIGFVLIAIGVGVAFMPLLRGLNRSRPRISTRSSRV